MESTNKIDTHNTESTISVDDKQFLEENEINIDNIIIKDHEKSSNYAWALYGKFTILIKKDTKMINITKLETNGKEVKNWLQNKKTQTRISYYYKKYKNNQNTTSAGIIPPPKKVLETINYGLNDLRGTYITFDLFPDFADWVSDEFYDACKDILNQYFTFEKDKLINNLEKKILDNELDINFKRAEIIKLEIENTEKDHQLLAVKTHRNELLTDREDLEERYTAHPLDKHKEEFLRITSYYNPNINRCIFKFYARQRGSMKRPTGNEKLLWEKPYPNAINLRSRIIKRVIDRYGGMFVRNNTIYVPPTVLKPDQILRMAEEERKRVDIKNSYFKLN